MTPSQEWLMRRFTPGMRILLRLAAVTRPRAVDIGEMSLRTARVLEQYGFLTVTPGEDSFGRTVHRVTLTEAGHEAASAR